MRLKDNKGFTLVELLVALMIVSVITISVTSFLIFGFDSFISNSKYIRQQDKVVDAVQLIRKDVEEASAIAVTRVGSDIGSVSFSFPGTMDKKTWKFIDDTSDITLDNKLACKIDKEVAGTLVEGVFETVLEDVNTPDSKFAFSLSDKRLILVIQPVRSNSGKYQAYNIKKPIITEFSVQYKSIALN